MVSIHRVAEKGSSRKPGIRQIQFSETELEYSEDRSCYALDIFSHDGQGLSNSNT